MAWLTMPRVITDARPRKWLRLCHCVSVCAARRNPASPNWASHKVSSSGLSLSLSLGLLVAIRGTVAGGSKKNFAGREPFVDWGVR